ncbi:MAG: hypothetical protein ACK4QP_23740 [Pseudorhizobium sp.]
MTERTIAFRVQPDMHEHGWDHDDWPELCGKFEAAGILVIGTPIRPGVQSSVCRLLIELLKRASQTTPSALALPTIFWPI